MALEEDIVTWFSVFKRFISLNDGLGIWMIALAVSVSNIQKFFPISFLYDLAFPVAFLYEQLRMQGGYT